MTTQTRIGGPVIMRTTETFWQHQKVGLTQQMMSFEQEVVWLARSESSTFAEHGGEEIKSGDTYNDFYGYLTSVSDTDDAKRMVKRYSITDESTLSIKIKAKVFLAPYIETEEDKRFNEKLDPNIKKRYTEIPDNFRLRKEMNENIHAGSEPYYPTISNIEHAEEIVWDSHKTEEENQAVIKKFIDQYSPENLQAQLETSRDVPLLPSSGELIPV